MFPNWGLVAGGVGILIPPPSTRIAPDSGMSFSCTDGNCFSNDSASKVGILGEENPIRIIQASDRAQISQLSSIGNRH